MTTQPEAERSMKGRLSFDQRMEIQRLFDIITWAGREIVRIAKLEKESRRRTTLHLAVRTILFWVAIGVSETVP